MHNARSLTPIPTDYTSVDILQRVEKYLLEMPQSPMTLQTDTVRRHFTKTCKIFTGNATITDDFTDRYSLLAFHRELQNIYWKCITDVYTDRYSPSIFVGDPKLPTESLTDSANSKRLALMNLCPHALSDGIPTNCEKYGG